MDPGQLRQLINETLSAGRQQGSRNANAAASFAVGAGQNLVGLGQNETEIMKSLIAAGFPEVALQDRFNKSVNNWDSASSNLLSKDRTSLGAAELLNSQANKRRLEEEVLQAQLMKAKASMEGTAGGSKEGSRGGSFGSEPGLISGGGMPFEESMWRGRQARDDDFNDTKRLLELQTSLTQKQDQDKRNFIMQLFGSLPKQKTTETETLVNIAGNPEKRTLKEVQDYDFSSLLAAMI